MYPIINFSKPSEFILDAIYSADEPQSSGIVWAGGDSVDDGAPLQSVARAKRASQEAAKRITS